MSLTIGEYITLGIMAASAASAAGGILYRAGVANHNDRLTRIGSGVQTSAGYILDTLNSLSAHVPNLDVAATKQTLINSEVQSLIEHNQYSVKAVGVDPEYLVKQITSAIGTAVASGGATPVASAIAKPTGDMLAAVKLIPVGTAAAVALSVVDNLPKHF